MNALIAQARRKLFLRGLQRLVLWILLVTGAGFLAVVFLNALGVSTPGQKGVVLLTLLVLTGGVAVEAARMLRAFRSSRWICNWLEDVHPEYRNILSTVTYVTSHSVEVAQLGYSSDLTEALKSEVQRLSEPQWERLGLSFRSMRSFAIGAGVAALVSLMTTWIKPETTHDLAVRLIAGTPIPLATPCLTLVLPEVAEVPLHGEVRLPSTQGEDPVILASEQIPAGAAVEVLVRPPGGAWRRLGSLDSPLEEPVHWRVDSELELCLFGENLRSSLCRIVPVYPPAVESFEAVLTPPDYTRLPPSTLVSPLRIESMTGSAVALQWRTNHPLASARFEILSETGALQSSAPLAITQAPELSTRFNLASSLRFRLELKDRFGQTAYTQPVGATPLEDRVPAVTILSPSREVVLPEDLRVPIQALATDDVALSSAALVYHLEAGVPQLTDTRLPIFNTAAGNLASASTVVCSPKLDLSEAGLWPGDRVTYWIEAVDWRGPSRPGQVGRSEVYSARFPSVDETLEEQASLRAETTGRFEDLMNEQREISRQFQEMRQDIQSTQKNKASAEANWENQKRLSDTIKRQADIQKQIEQLAEKFEDSLERLEETGDITLRTLQKFERVQQLLDEVLSEESKQVLKDLQETLRKIEDNQLRPEDLDQTEQTLADFEKQLDRQLALLENIWMEQQAEALQKQAEELAGLQEELRRDTEELHTATHPEEASRDAQLEEAETQVSENLEDLMQQMAEDLKTAMEQAQARKEQLQAAGAETEPASQEQAVQSPDPMKEEAQTEKQDPGAPTENEAVEESGPSPEEELSKAEQEDSGDKPEGLQDKADSGQEEESLEGGQSEDQSSEESESTSQGEEGTEESDQGGQESMTPEEKVLADRQEQVNRDTEALLEELKRLEEKASQQPGQMSQNLDRLRNSTACKTVSKNQKSALSKLKKSDLKAACSKQSKAKKNLDDLSQGLSGCCSGSGKDMEEQVAKMKEILERAFILSGEAELNDQETARFRSLPAWPNSERMSKLGREMGLFRQEASRLSAEYKKVTEKNPFADFTVVKRFDQAARNWKENTRVIEETSPNAVSVRTHQSQGQVNLAIAKLLDSIKESQSQSSGGAAGSMEKYFQSLKKMLSDQKNLNQDTQGLKEQMRQGNQHERIEQETNRGGEGASEGMRKMAEQQRGIRRQLEELEKKYQNMKQRTGSLEGVGGMMKDVEKDLEHGQLNDQVTDIQSKIEQRLLDAERSLHEKGFKKKRKALQAEGEGVEGEAGEAPLSGEEGGEAELARLLRRNLEDVSPHWRERVRAYYDNLLKMNP